MVRAKTDNRQPAPSATGAGNWLHKATRKHRDHHDHRDTDNQRDTRNTKLPDARREAQAGSPPEPNLASENKGFTAGTGEPVTPDKLDLATSYLVHVEPFSPANRKPELLVVSWNRFPPGAGSPDALVGSGELPNQIPETFALLALWSRCPVGAG